MNSSINLYLHKRGVKGAWEISPIPAHKFQSIVIIPAYAELEYIGQTLDSLSHCDVDSFNDILVVVVVNNEADATSQIIENNKQTISNLENRNDPFLLALIDAVSDEKSITKKHAGV